VLDAYIIERIKREQEQRDSNRVPLQKEPEPKPLGGHQERTSWHDDHRGKPERGVVIIDM